MAWRTGSLTTIIHTAGPFISVTLTISKSRRNLNNQPYYRRTCRRLQERSGNACHQLREFHILIMLACVNCLLGLEISFNTCWFLCIEPYIKVCGSRAFKIMRCHRGLSLCAFMYSVFPEDFLIIYGLYSGMNIDNVHSSGPNGSDGHEVQKAVWRSNEVSYVTSLVPRLPIVHVSPRRPHGSRQP